MISYTAPDLTQHPPRSPRVRLGGFVHLPRLLDKARAFAAGKNGEYNFDSALDNRFFEFTGLTAEQLLEAVKTGKNDTEMLAWVEDNAKPSRLDWEIDAWSQWVANMPPGDIKRHRMAADLLEKHAPTRTDMRTNFDRLDFDDYITFGGRP